MKSDLTLPVPYSYQQHRTPQLQQPSSSSLAREGVNQTSDRLLTGGVGGHVDDVGPAGNSAELIDLSRSRRTGSAADVRGRPSATVQPHRPASSSTQSRQPRVRCSRQLQLRVRDFDAHCCHVGTAIKHPCQIGLSRTSL